MLPNTRLLARAFHRIPQTTSPTTRRLSTSQPLRKWEGSKPEDHVTNEPDTHNVRHDAHGEGQEERRKGDGSRGTSEKAGDANKKAKEEFPEAPE